MRRYLTPTMLGAHVVAVICVGLALGLGLWQFGAWQAQREAEAIDLTQRDPMDLLDVMGPDDSFPGDRVGQPVTLSGTWVPDATVFVEGRRFEGRDGFWVVTPITTGTESDPALPVVRGWVPSPDLAPAPPTGTADLEGLLQPSEGTGAFDEDPLDDVFPQLRIADLVQRLDNDLYAGYVVLREPVPGDAQSADLVVADVEQLPEPGQFTALRNLLYAVEWWVFGAFALFIWWRYVKESTEQPASGAPVALDT
ncbi:SURF1 family protein [Nocardioides sp.]|uniref:SURF1 family protein n=1 Tax=Nocardioides sp. TaxID=35761 RepID=UPI002B26AB99|nr:SURF1 family protein [Nocardioides sp.]